MEQLAIAQTKHTTGFLPISPKTGISRMALDTEIEETDEPDFVDYDLISMQVESQPW